MPDFVSNLLGQVGGAALGRSDQRHSLIIEYQVDDLCGGLAPRSALVARDEHQAPGGGQGGGVPSSIAIWAARPSASPSSGVGRPSGASKPKGMSVPARSVPGIASRAVVIDCVAVEGGVRRAGGVCEKAAGTKRATAER